MRLPSDGFLPTIRYLPAIHETTLGIRIDFHKGRDMSHCGLFASSAVYVVIFDGVADGAIESAKAHQRRWPLLTNIPLLGCLRGSP